MLIDFTLENWMSYRDPVTFTMNPDDENQSNYVLPKLEDESEVIPIAGIFGGNASGKSNFVKSLEFARKFILRGVFRDEFIPIDTFELQEGYENKPVKLSFTVACEGKVYTYEFAVTIVDVISEAMYEHKGDEETCLFNFEFGKSINVNNKFEHKELIEYIIELKRRDQLLLTAISNLTNIKLPVYYWFLNLNVFEPRFSNFKNATTKNIDLREHMNDIFEEIDCGIEKVAITASEQYKMKTSTGRAKKNTIKEKNIQKNSQTIFEDAIINAVSETSVEPRHKLVTLHKTFEGKLKQFDLHKESDGTIRLLELIPVFIELSKKDSKAVFVIDEIENSLHTYLLCELINAYILNCNEKTRTQLIFTSQDLQIMDEIGLLKDEIWMTERNSFGKSNLFSLADFEDVDLSQSIRKNYLFGKFGGVPNLSLLPSHLTEPKPK